jgi:hypothetical protein
MRESPVWVSWKRLDDGRRLFWCTGMTPEFLEWLNRRSIEFQIVFIATAERHAWRDTVIWIFRDPRDAYWCDLRFSAWQRDYFPDYHFYEWHDHEYLEYNDWWDDNWPISEEMTWEREVGSLNLGSTGGCPMWQEGPRPRPLARPRRDAH